MWFQFDPVDDTDAPGSRECHSLDARGDTLFLFGGNDQHQRMNAVVTLNTDTMKWASVDATGEVPVRRSAHSTALVDSRYLYVFGGWDGQEELGDLHMLDTETNVWTRVVTRGAPPAPRHFHNTVVANNNLYVFGGYDGHAWRNDVVALDLATKTWHNVISATQDKPGVRASGSACVISGNRILVFGGYDGSEFLQDLWILHTDTNKGDGPGHRWERVQPPRRRRGEKTEWPQARSGHASAVVGNLAIFFGGRHRAGRFNDINIFNTETMAWAKPQIRGKLPKPRKTHAMTMVGTKMYLFGGHDGEDWLRDFHILDVECFVKASKPVLTVAVPESSLTADLSALLDIDISADGLERLIREELAEEASDWQLASPVHGGGASTSMIRGGGDADPRGCAAAPDIVSPPKGGGVAVHSDVTFLVEGRAVRLHKAVLSARCEYFRSMFCNGFNESSQSTINLSDIAYPVFVALVRFLYTDHIPPPSVEALVLPLLQQSQKMGLQRLSCLCQRQLEARLEPVNASAMLEAADTHGALPLRAACLRYILANFSSVSRTHGFLSLREDLLREVLFRRARRSVAELPAAEMVKGGGGRSVAIDDLSVPLFPPASSLTSPQNASNKRRRQSSEGGLAGTASFMTMLASAGVAAGAGGVAGAYDGDGSFDDDDNLDDSQDDLRLSSAGVGTTGLFGALDGLGMGRTSAGRPSVGAALSSAVLSVPVAAGPAAAGAGVPSAAAAAPSAPVASAAAPFSVPTVTQPFDGSASGAAVAAAPSSSTSHDDRLQKRQRRKSSQHTGGMSVDDDGMGDASDDDGGGDGTGRGSW